MLDDLIYFTNLIYFFYREHRFLENYEIPLGRKFIPEKIDVRLKLVEDPISLRVIERRYKRWMPELERRQKIEHIKCRRSSN